MTGLEGAEAKPPTAVDGCPVCGEKDAVLLHTHTVDAAAQHFIPRDRDPERHTRVHEIISMLWSGRDTVEVRRCGSCGFGFAVPFVAGSPEFYNAVSGARPHYPRRRWEFDRTVAALDRLSHVQGELLECGAGSGAFLRQVRASSIGARFRLSALEYDNGALSKLRKAGIAADNRSIVELARDADRGHSYAVICMFQTLEHMDDVHSVFHALSRLCRPGGDIFLSVPDSHSTDLQERLTGFWDMPPNHVGRWTRLSFQRMADRHHLLIVEHEVEPCSKARELHRMALYALNGRAYDAHTLAATVNRIPFRPLRGPLKHVIAVTLVPALWRETSGLSGHSQWLHLRAADSSA